MRSRFINLKIRNKRFSFHIRLKPRSLPPYWRKVTSGTGIDGYICKRDTSLVLDSQGIPFRSSLFRGQEHLYVPPLLERRAFMELAYYAAEQPPLPALRHYPVYRDSALAALFLLPLIFWHGLQSGWWPAPHFLPAPSAWQDLGKIDAVKIVYEGQWQRLATALTLHSGLPHLFSNVAFGALFLALLARSVGIGRAFLLTVLGGIAGNGLSVALHDAAYQSIGFSTALFACVGILAGIAAARMQVRQKILMPAAAAFALFAMLGTAGEHTDFTAHLCGLFVGLIIGFLVSFLMSRNIAGISQFWSGILGLALLAGGWMWTFSRGNF